MVNKPFINWSMIKDMKNARNVFNCQNLQIFFICFTFFVGLSCKQNPNFSIDYHNQPINTRVGSIDSKTEDIENEKIIMETIESFWRFSTEGDDMELRNYITEAPAEFWKDCTQQVESREIANANVSFPDDTDEKFEGIGISVNEKKDSFWILENFAQQIKSAKLKLLKAKIVRSNTDEAIVKIDWNKTGDEQSWISLNLLLYKYDSKWKIFTIIDSMTLARYNKEFGYKDKCK